MTFLPNEGAAKKKVCLPTFSLVLGIESCCDVSDLSRFGVFDR